MEWAVRRLKQDLVNIPALFSAGYAFMAAAVTDANPVPVNAYLQRESNMSLLGEAAISVTTAGQAVALVCLHSDLPKVGTGWVLLSKFRVNLDLRNSVGSFQFATVAMPRWRLIQLPLVAGL